MSNVTRSMVVAAAFAAAAGCSHSQTKQATASAANARAAEMPRPAAAQPSAPEPPSPAPATDTSAAGGDDAVFFDFDSSLLRDEARPILQRIAHAATKKNAALRVEGNCDESGTTEYNLALGEN